MKVSKKSILFAAMLVFASGLIYFYAAFSQSKESMDAASQIQTMFFTVSGIAFVPLGIWMLKNRLYSRAPYVIATIISVAMIGFYVASRTVNLPVVGIQDDTGPIDIASKVVQGTIIITSALLMPHLKREQLAILSKSK
ncbi:MAG: hypothetical protein HY295_02135 [Thaumarchaeota archaeon]|nr:hypothetical protein [Nitrososphaerota archaeon]